MMFDFWFSLKIDFVRGELVEGNTYLMKLISNQLKGSSRRKGINERVENEKEGS
jgi:hypothetical protein